MKKFASLILALALCMGLAVPASAADYGSVSVKTEDGVVTFEAATKGEATTVKFKSPETDELTDEVYVPITLKPGSNLKVEGSVLYGIYGVTAEGVLFITGFADYLDTGSVDEYFDKGKYSLEGNNSCAMELWGADGTQYLVKLGDGTATAPTTPVKPEQPAESTAPTQPTTPTQPTAPTQPTTPAQPAAPAAAGSYTVKKGDTYGTIALNNYGTYGVWKALYKANKGAKLTAGVTLTLPEKLGKTAKIANPVAAQGETLYTVKAGDTLGTIAKAHYGSSQKYQAIFQRNTDRLKNANTIYEGQVIVLPAK